MGKCIFCFYTVALVIKRKISTHLNQLSNAARQSLTRFIYILSHRNRLPENLVKQYKEDGAVLLKGVFSPKWIDSISEGIVRYFSVIKSKKRMAYKK